MKILKNMQNSVIEGNIKKTEGLVEKALEQKLSPTLILNEGLVSAMTEVGDLFEQQVYFIPEMMISARAMQNSLNILRPYLVESGVNPIGKVVLGTVTGDLHDIGKNMVGMLLEGAGFEVEDLGVNVSPKKFVQAVKDGAQIIGMSALLTTTMENMKRVINSITEAGLRDNVKVIIGGAPVTHKFAEEIGADGYAPDASNATKLAKSLIF